MAKTKKRKSSGTKRMRANGMYRVEVWFDSTDVLIITRAAELVGRKLATFVREASVGAGAVVVNAESSHQGPNAEFWEQMTQLDIARGLASNAQRK